MALQGIQLVASALQELPSEFWSRQSRETRVLRAQTFLDENYQRAISNRELAGRAHCSIETLCRLFQRELGLSPRQYLISLRLAHARKLLQTSDLSLEAIAEQCGFADRTHFTKAFTRKFIQPPAAFRREAGQREQAARP